MQELIVLMYNATVSPLQYCFCFFQASFILQLLYSRSGKLSIQVSIISIRSYCIYFSVLTIKIQLVYFSYSKHKAIVTEGYVFCEKGFSPHSVFLIDLFQHTHFLNCTSFLSEICTSGDLFLSLKDSI